MRRWLLLFLLAFLPLQLSWAAVAGYCQHEDAPGKVAHFGHHTHDHDEHASPAGADGVAVEKAAFGVDDDCAFCHLGGAQSLPSKLSASPAVMPSLLIGMQPVLYGSHIPDMPERPDRRIA